MVAGEDSERSAAGGGVQPPRSASDRAAGNGERAQGSRGDGDEQLKMSELAARSGVSKGTIRHYLREGLLGDGSEIARTSRNMAYYPAEFVSRVMLIKRLQEERFIPLRVISELLRDSPQRVEALLEREDAIVEGTLASASAGSRSQRVSVEEAAARFRIERNVLARLEQLSVLEPSQEGYDADEIAILDAIARFRAGGYEEALGFTVYDTERYLKALQPLVRDEVRSLLRRLASEVEVDRALEMVAAGVAPLRDLVAAMHSKLLLRELTQEQDRRRRRAGKVGGVAEGGERRREDDGKPLSSSRYPLAD